MWGSLGDHVFGLLTAPEELRVTDATDYAEQKRIGRKPLLQRAGEALQDLHVTLKLHRSADPNLELTLRALQDDRRQGTILPFVIGRGDSGIYASDVVITRLEHRPLQYAGELLLAVEITISLKEFVMPEELAISTRPRPKAIVKKGETPKGPEYKIVKKKVNGWETEEMVPK